MSRHLVLLSALVLGTAAHAWDYAGHRLVNQFALASLPADFPAFVREPANAERVAFLAGEPDRWRNVSDLPLKQSGGSWTDHFCDLEQLADAGLDPAKVPSFRYDFILQFAAGRLTHPQNFPAIDPAKNADHTREWPGFAPWAMTEYYAKLKSGFGYLKVLEELGTPEEVANARANIVYIMGVMGHYIGDCAQPLHTTVHHNGWVGPNPHGYSEWSGIHSWVDGGFLARSGLQPADILAGAAPVEALPLAAQPDGRDPFFVQAMAYLIEQNQLVEPLYQLEKQGLLRIDEHHQPSAEGKAFITARLQTGGRMLARVWVTAWKNAEPDKYLRSQLLQRQAAATPAK